MTNWLISPPIAFVVLFMAVSFLLFLTSKLSFRVDKPSEASKQPYACGEEDYNHTAQPDYSIFFPFAFFFTLAHVATLIMTTVPVANLRSIVVAFSFIVGAVLGLYILFRR